MTNRVIDNLFGLAWLVFVFARVCLHHCPATPYHHWCTMATNHATHDDNRHDLVSYRATTVLSVHTRPRLLESCIVSTCFLECS